jgi:hypothetical protein
MTIVTIAFYGGEITDSINKRENKKTYEILELHGTAFIKSYSIKKETIA